MGNQRYIPVTHAMSKVAEPGPEDTQAEDMHELTEAAALWSVLRCNRLSTQPPPLALAADGQPTRILGVSASRVRLEYAGPHLVSTTR